MKNNKTELKELPKDIKFATYNSDNEDIIFGEYLIATLLYNGESLDKILKYVNEIKNKKEKEDVKTIIINMVLDFINLNPEYVYLVNDSDGASELLSYFIEGAN